MKPTFLGRVVSVAVLPHVAAGLLLATTLLWSAPATAQLTRVGNTVGVMDLYTWGTDSCYDPTHQIYLIVGGQGDLAWTFTNTDGVPVSGAARLGTSNSAGDPTYGLFPHCAYSHDVAGGQGGFLVTWYQAGTVRAVVIADPNGAAGAFSSAETLISLTPDVSASVGGPGVAYSRTSQRFLVTWPTLAFDIAARFVATDGVALGSLINVLQHTSTIGAMFPAVAWNSDTDQFGIAYSGFNDGNHSAFAALKRVRPSDGAMSGETTAGVDTAVFATDVAYNSSTHRYLVGWSVPPGSKDAEIDGTGNAVRSGLLSSRVGSPQSFGVSYNPISGTFLAVSEDANTYDVAGLELNSQGIPKTETQGVLTNGGGSTGSFWPRISTRSDAKQWNITFARRFTSAASQIISTTSSEAGPSSDVQIGLNSPSDGAVLRPGESLTISGWVLDRGATSGSGIDYVDVWLNPGSNGIYVGRVSTFSARQDVSNLLGAQFVNTGFAISTSGLAAGSYTVVVYPHSSVLGAFDFQHAVAVHVSVGNSFPLMSLDSPANGATIVGPVTVSGWALDKSASSGIGIDRVDVWAFPANGAPAIGPASATLGLSRPDVGTFFGAQFTMSGFAITGSLPPGTYTLVAYAHDTSSGQFRVYQAKTITVQSELLVIDAPGNGGVAALGSTLSGWAVSLGAGAGSGIDFVHVYARRVLDGFSFFVGQADLWVSRPDIAAIFGAQYGSAGFSLPLTDSRLKGQPYDLTIYAHSVTGAISAKVVRVTIQ